MRKFAIDYIKINKTTTAHFIVGLMIFSSCIRTGETLEPRPVADACFDVNAAESGVKDFEFEFTACEQGEEHRWDFGDGASGSGYSAKHTYSDFGVYTVTHTMLKDGSELAYQANVAYGKYEISGFDVVIRDEGNYTYSFNQLCYDANYYIALSHSDTADNLCHSNYYNEPRNCEMWYYSYISTATPELVVEAQYECSNTPYIYKDFEGDSELNLLDSLQHYRVFTTDSGGRIEVELTFEVYVPPYY